MTWNQRVYTNNEHFKKIIYAKRSPLPGSISHVESFTASVNVGFTVKNTTQEPIDFLATSKAYAGSYPLFTRNSQLKNGLEVSNSQNCSTPEIVRFLGGTLLCFVGDTKCHPGGRDGISTYPTTKKMLSFHFALKQHQSTKSVKTQKTFFSKRNGMKQLERCTILKSVRLTRFHKQSCLANFVDFVERFVSIVTHDESSLKNLKQ